VAVTQRDQLEAALQAAGLRLSPVEVTALLPAWRRYRKLVTTFSETVAEDLLVSDG
jgi:hypothetical protein